uniref:Uncharacterized protein n=1 Tax=Anguilla anguilla TaxID=7936 RepID=A0A0E9TSH0_ANGAN
MSVQSLDAQRLLHVFLLSLPGVIHALSVCI